MSILDSFDGGGGEKVRKWVNRRLEEQERNLSSNLLVACFLDRSISPIPNRRESRRG
jgi:hypothetical protein